MKWSAASQAPLPRRTVRVPTPTSRSSSAHAKKATYRASGCFGLAQSTRRRATPRSSSPWTRTRVRASGSSYFRTCCMSPPKAGAST